MSKARVFLAIVGGVHHFIDEHPTAAVPLFKAALQTFREILDLRLAYEQDEAQKHAQVYVSATRLAEFEERLAKLERRAVPQ